MKATIDRAAFLLAAKLAASAAPKRTTKEVLFYVLAQLEPAEHGNQRLVFTGTDLETSVTAGLLVPEDRIEPGGSTKFLVSERVLGLLHNDDSELVEATWTDTGLGLVTDGVKFEEGTPPPDLFPEVGAAIEKPTWEEDVPGPALVTALRRVAASVDRLEHERVVLKVVCFDGDENGNLALVASDGYRMACQSVGVAPPPAPLLLPGERVRQAIALASEAESVRITADADRISMECGEARMTARLREGRFPKWQNWAPPRSHSGAEVPVNVLVSHLRRMKEAELEFDPASRPGVRLELAKDRLSFELYKSSTKAQSQVPLTGVPEWARGQAGLNVDLALPLLTPLPGDALVRLSVGGRVKVDLSMEDGWRGTVQGRDD